MKPSELAVDIELRDFLTGKVLIGTTSLPVYADGERPSNKVPDDFIEINYNGDPWSVTDKMSMWRGNLIVSLYCKLNEDSSVKTNRVRKLLEQFDSIINRKASEHYFYNLDLNRPITPTTANLQIGYSATVLNVEWRTL